MRKPRRQQGFLAALSAEQRGQLDRLLFDETHSYKELVRIMKERFGVTTSEAALGNYYQRHARKNIERGIAMAAEESTVRASGVEVTIQCSEPGEIRLAIRPLHGLTPAAAPATDETTLRAAGLEIAVVSRSPDEVHLAVLPLRDEEQPKPGGAH